MLIDADNTSPKVTDGLFDEVAKIGEASLRRIYGDFSKGQQAGWERMLARHADPARVPSGCRREAAPCNSGCCDGKALARLLRWVNLTRSTRSCFVIY